MLFWDSFNKISLFFTVCPACTITCSTCRFSSTNTATSWLPSTFPEPFTSWVIIWFAGFLVWICITFTESETLDNMVKISIITKNRQVAWINFFFMSNSHSVPEHICKTLCILTISFKFHWQHILSNCHFLSSLSSYFSFYSFTAVEAIPCSR